jgi:hypothetical protein
MNGETAQDWGPWGIIGLFLLKWAKDEWQAWKSRQWRKEDISGTKTDELYERMLEQQKDTLHIMDRNTDKVDENTKALVENLPAILQSVRDLTERMARLERVGGK